MEAQTYEDPIFGKPVFTYTRAQAIEDGELIDASKMAREAGFSVPVAVTRNLWFSYIKPHDELRGSQDEDGRLWDVLSVAKWAAKMTQPGTSHMTFEVTFQMWSEKRKAHPETPKIWAIAGPGDSGELVDTIMLPEDY